MDIRKIKKLIDLIEESNIGEIEIKEGEESVRISGLTPAMPMQQQVYANTAQAPALDVNNSSQTPSVAQSWVAFSGQRSG